MYIYIPSLFVFYLRLWLAHTQALFLPVDSSMSLSVTECNWFCQGQSIAPCRARSAADRGCITVKLYTAYRNHTVFVHVGWFQDKLTRCCDESRGHLTPTISEANDQVNYKYETGQSQVRGATGSSETS